MLSLVHVLEWRAATSPEALALTDQQGAQLTYAGLAAAMDRSAARFAAAGVAAGDVVPVIARNQAGWVTAMLGLIRAGALPAAVNWRLAAPGVAALLRLARPALIVADAGSAALARQAAAGLDRPVHVLDDFTGAPVGVPRPLSRRNATGKVLRAALREPFWAGRDRTGLPVVHLGGTITTEDVRRLEDDDQ